MFRSRFFLMLAVSGMITFSHLGAQNSGAVFRRSGVLNGNQVKTVFGNWGVIGQPANRGPRGAWIFDTNGYIGDVSLLVGAEVTGIVPQTGRPKTVFWVIDCPVDRPSSGGFDESNNGVRQAFEPVRGYFNEAAGTPAISGDEGSWPPFWPDKLDDPLDPGWPGSWNGIFGKLANADLETYFVMDDNNDNEFNLPSENSDTLQFFPDPNNPNRFGMGLEVKQRGLQWQQILAQDNIFWLYEVTNNGQTLYPRTVFGMLVGTYVGVTGSDNSPQEFDDDWSFFDVAEDLTYTGDFGNDVSRNPFWQGDVGMVSYAFLESPGNPFDGIDNDKDSDEGAVAPTGPFFEEEDFDEVVVTNSPNPGPGQVNKIVTIDEGTFERTVITFPTNTDTLVVVSLGDTITLVANQTRLAEGNRITINGQLQINPNAFDGKDNDLDGLIDENFNLHYLQERVDSDGTVLFSILNPVRHIDYRNGIGLNDPLIDERRDDGIDNDGDWNFEFDDVGADGLPETGDLGEGDGFPTPGEPNFDQTDVSESDQIGLSSFNYFSPANQIAMADDRSVWEQMRPGFFDVPSSIVNGRPIAGEDGDFIYGTGYFPLTPGQTERISLALLYGDDLPDILKKLPIVRQIFESDYRFPIAPDKPTLRTIAGDDSVVLYWDRKAERSFDPVLREFDFEGYKIFRATDPNFNDARVITNSGGNVVAFKPIAQFDVENGIFGFFEAPSEIFQQLRGWAFDLGTDNGLRHSYVDHDVENGRTYYYAVVSYDHGVNQTGVIPSESTKSIVQKSNGELILDINTAVVTPQAPVAGYVDPQRNGELEHTAGEGFGTITYNVLDPSALTGNEYEVYFFDTSNDGLDNDGDWDILTDDLGEDGLANTGDPGEDDGKPTPGEPNFDFTDADELAGITSRYNVLDLTEYQEEFAPKDTFFVSISRQNLLPGSITVRDGLGNVVPPENYEIDVARGQIRASAPGSLPGEKYLIEYQYHPVYFSQYMQGNTALNVPVLDTDNFDGVTLNFDNIWRTESDTAGSGWNNGAVNYTYQQAFVPINVGGQRFDPVFFPSNYELRVFDHVVDTTSNLFNVPSLPPTPRKFLLYNKTGDYQIEYVHADIDGDSLPSPLEPIIFLERDPGGQFTVYTWQLQLETPESDPYQFQGGEVLSLIAKFPFNRFDRFRLKTELPSVSAEAAKSELDAIRVVPNPYIVSHEFEPALPPGITSGRGERIIYFTHLPDQAKVHIFTARGGHVVTLEDDNSIFEGTITWNLKTKENLDIAYGVYFYVVESPIGTKRGKFAVIK